MLDARVPTVDTLRRRVRVLLTLPLPLLRLALALVLPLPATVAAVALPLVVRVLVLAAGGDRSGHVVLAGGGVVLRVLELMPVRIRVVDRDIHGLPAVLGVGMHGLVVLGLDGHVVVSLGRVLHAGRGREVLAVLGGDGVHGLASGRHGRRGRLPAGPTGTRERDTDGRTPLTGRGRVRLVLETAARSFRRADGTDRQLLGPRGRLGFARRTDRGRLFDAGVGRGRRGVGAGGRVVAARVEPRFAARSDRPLARTARLVAVRPRELDECLAHGGLVADTVVDFGGVLAVVCSISGRSWWLTLWCGKVCMDGEV